MLCPQWEQILNRFSLFTSERKNGRGITKVSNRWYSHFRPSLLVGNRQEFRFGERMAEKLSRIIPFIFKGAFKKYKPISAKDVAKGMYITALREESGIHIYNSNEITTIE